MRITHKAGLILAGVVYLAACAMNKGTSTHAATMNDVKAVMHDSTGKELGTLMVTEVAHGLMVTGTLTGLPAGEHAIHIHAVGQCAPTFAAAGPHWNPENRQHGTMNPAGPHYGDMPNITVGTDGTVSIHVMSPNGTLHGTNPLFDADGAAIVVHAKADDNKSDPAGNAGTRIACGVISSS